MSIFEELSIIDNMKIGHYESKYEFPFYNIFFPKKNKNREEELNEKARSIFDELFGPDNIFWTDRLKAAGTLSYGHQRLLALARLLMGEYTLFLLDEPTAGINIRFIDQIVSAVEHMQKKNKNTVMLIEHNVQFVRQIADVCFFMDNGTIITNGSPNDVLDNEQVKQIYIGL